MNVGRIGGEDVYFSETDFELVQLFAAQAAVALRNADEHHAMSMRAETDALTGLGNHGAFQRDLATATEAAASAPPEAGQLGLLMMDLDRFKTYNDRFGHPAGDALLHAVGEALYAATRSDDRVYRYGGDEFTIVLSGVDLAEAQRVAERARRLVAAVSLERGAAPVTITVGVALFPDHGATKDALIAAADAAMYAGKQAGGDRVVVPGEADAGGRREAAEAARPRHGHRPRRRRSDAPSDPRARRPPPPDLRPGRAADRMLSSPPQCVIDAASRCALRRGPSSAGAARGPSLLLAGRGGRVRHRDAIAVAERVLPPATPIPTPTPLPTPASRTRTIPRCRRSSRTRSPAWWS